MENGGINEEELNRFKEYRKLREKARKDLKSYAEILKGISDIQEQIVFFKREIEGYQQKKLEFAEKELELAEEIRKAEAEKNEEQLKSLKLQELQLKANQEQNENNERIARAQLKGAEELGAELAKQVNGANALGASYGSFKAAVGWTYKTLARQTDHLFEQQKAVKMSELQMGLLANRSKDYQENLFNAALHTNIIGTSSADLAEMQGNYADEVGRTVLLTEEGHQAMAALAQGTMLGKENAARFAAQMEIFGHSVEASKGFMEDTLNMATKMGLSGSRVTKEVVDALKMAQTFNFRNGVKGAAKMAMLITKTKLEISSIQGIAEKAFNPEGAVELASQLSVLGGTWAQLGDPFSLMFKARNDIEGLTEDIAKAASAGAEFNKETGEFEIASAQLHRLREVSNATGISMDELTNSARNAAKYSKIKAEVRGNFDPEIMDFLAATAQMDEKSGKFKVSIDGDTHFVDSLQNFTNDQLKAIAEEKATLEQRAKQSKTFDETWENLKNQFKATLLPGFTVVADRMTKGLLDLSNWMKEEKILEKIQAGVKWVGNIVEKVVGWVSDNPEKAIIGAAAAGLAYLVADNAVWLLRGRMLGMGFNSVAGGGLLGGGGGGGVDVPGGGGGPKTKGPKYRMQGGVEQIKTKSGKWVNADSPQGRMSANMRGAGRSAGRFGQLGKVASIGGKVLGVAGALLSVSSLAMDGIENANDESLDTGEAIGKTIDQNKGALIGGIAGAIIGSVVPVIGTAIGAGIGSGIGSMFDGEDSKLWGSYGQDQNTTAVYGSSPFENRSTPSSNSNINNYSSNQVTNQARPQTNMGQENQDFVSRPGQEPIPFSSADTLVGMKKGGGIDNFLSKKENKSTGNMDVIFKNAMKVEGKITLEGSGGKSVKIDLDDPILIRQLSRLVQEELTISLNGKRNPNPVN